MKVNRMLPKFFNLTYCISLARGQMQYNDSLKPSITTAIVSAKDTPSSGDTRNRSSKVI